MVIFLKMVVQVQFEVQWIRALWCLKECNYVVKKMKDQTNHLPLGFQGYPAKVSKMSRFHFSEGITLVIVRDLTTPRAVAIKCSLLSESLPHHMPLVNEESVLATSCSP